MEPTLGVRCERSVFDVGFFRPVEGAQGWRNGAEWESELPEVTVELHIHTQLVLCGFDTEALKPNIVQQ